MASKSKLRRHELLPPFSEDDQGNYLSKIHDKLSGIKEEMKVTIEDHLALYMETMDHTTQLSQQVGRVSQELDNIRSRVSDPENSLLAVINTTRRRKALADSERHTGVLIKVLESLMHVKKELDTLHTLIQQRKLTSSIRVLNSTSNLISSLPGAYTPGDEPIIYGTIKQRFSKLSQDISEILQNSFTSAFRFDSKNSVFAITTSVNDAPNGIELDELVHPSPLSTSLALLHAIELGYPAIDRLAASLLPFIDSFLVEPSKTMPLPTLEIYTSRNEALLTVKPSKSQNDRIHDIATSLGTAVSFFQFLTDYIIMPCEREYIQLQMILNPDVSTETLKTSISGLCLRLGTTLLQYTVDRLVSRCFESSIPEHRSELQKYQRDVEVQMDRFIPTLSDFTWLPAKDLSHPSPLSLSTSSEVWNSKLLHFLKSALLHFGNKKKLQALSRVRSLLLSGQYTSRPVGDLEFGGGDSDQMVPSGVLITSPLFKFPECRVREVIIELVDIADELAAEAFYTEDEKESEMNRSSLDSTSANEVLFRNLLLETIKDIYDLYRSIIPSYEQSKIANIPQLSMLFHNDCQYMAHRITLMSMRYRIQLSQMKMTNELSSPPVTHLVKSPSTSTTAASSSSSSSQISRTQPTSSAHHFSRNKLTSAGHLVPDISQISNPTFSFVDLVTSFRSMAEKFYNDIITGLREQLQILLDNTGRLKDTHHEDRKKKALVVMRHIVNELENKDRNWSDTLPKELHKVTMGHLVNDVVEWMIGMALETTDFTAEETESLHIIFLAIFPLAKIFLDVSDSHPSELSSSSKKDMNPSSNDSVESLASITKSSCARYVKSWLRFEELTDAFKMPMIEIVDRFNSGNLHFTREEVESLIKACFEDSAKRAERIASLRMDII